MAVEIERKFLVADDRWQSLATSSSAIRQGYLSEGGAASVRVRIVDDASAMLTIKSAPDREQGRLEFEYRIPVADAETLLALSARRVIAKRRHIVPAGATGLVWEVDVFEGRLAGLVLAEIELDDVRRAIALPGWIGREVTDDPRYYNEHLAGLADATQIGS